MPTPPALVLALALSFGAVLGACASGTDEPAVVLNCSDAESTDNLDQDGDGFSPCGGDCDDTDPDASPAGVESSQTDGYDQDCDNFDPARE